MMRFCQGMVQEAAILDIGPPLFYNPIDSRKALEITGCCPVQ